MGLETGTYISDLNASNPVGATDPKSQGDDHIRLIKSTILSTFPNIDAAVTATEDDLNILAGAVAANRLDIPVGDTLRIQDGGGTDFLDISHDGTDAIIAGTNTTNLNLTGFTAVDAGTVDADFDAITATSYGGITEANLVDKSAAETISGTWDFTDVDINGTLTVDTIATDAASLNFGSVAITSDNDSADEPGYKGTPQLTKAASYQLALADAGKQIYLNGGTGQTLTIPANGTTAFPVGTIFIVVNDSGNDWTIAITTDTLEEYVTGTTGSQTLSDNNKAVLEKVTSTLWKYQATS